MSMRYLYRPCLDCNSLPISTYWGDGPRCESCTKTRNDELYAARLKRAAEERAALAAHRAAGCPDDGITCSDCCEHEFDSSEGYMCLNCGTDGFDDVMSNAYETAKNIRKCGV